MTGHDTHDTRKSKHTGGGPARPAPDGSGAAGERQAAPLKAAGGAGGMMTGIRVSESCAFEITGNKVTNAALCLEICGSSQVKASGNTFAGTGAAASCGVSVKGTAEVEIVETGVTDTEHGINCGEESHVRIGSVTIASSGEGIQVEGISHAEVAGSTITSAGSACISYGMNAGGVVEKNALRGASGVEVQGSGQVKVAGNVIVAEQRGIGYRDQSTGTASGNRITGSSGANSCGVSIEGTAEVEVIDTEVCDTDRGINCTEGSQVTIDSARITCLSEGIRVEGISHAGIAGSTITSAKGPCISFAMNANGVVERNELKGVSGLDVRGSGQVKISGNTIEAGEAGIGFKDQSSGEVTLNRIRGVPGGESCGITIAGTAAVVIGENDIGGAERGICCGEESQVKVGSVKIASSGEGIQVEGVCHVEVAESAITSVKGPCISFGMNASGVAEKNELRGARGLEARGSSQVKAVGNTIIFELKGIGYRDQSAGAVAGNTLTGTKAAGSCGISIEGTAEVEISGNKVGDTEQGITCSEESQVKIQEMTIASSGAGIQVEGVSHAEIALSTITSVKGPCVSYGTSASGIVEKCGLKGPSCLEARGSSQVQATGNTITFELKGIGYCDQSTGAASANTIIGTKAADSCGISVEGTAEVELAGNAVSDTEQGIICIEESQVKIAENTIISGSTGIGFKDQSSGAVALNRIKGTSANSCGISIEGTAAVEINDNTVSDTGQGITCSEESQVKIRAMTIASGGVGVQAEGVSHAEIASSTITSAKGPCVSYGTNASGTVEKSELKGANVIEARGSSQVKIAGNTISFEVKGISYRDQSAGAVAGNTLTGTKAAGSCGISIEGTAEVEISDNKVGDTEQGIACSEESQVKISAMTIASDGEGVQVEGVSRTEIAGSTITSVKGPCVSFGTSASGIVEKSELKGASGLEARGSSQVKAAGNTFTIGLRGIGYRDQSTGAASANTIIGTKAADSCGISVEGTAEVELVGNAVSDTEQGIICIEESQVKIAENTIASGSTGIGYKDQSSGEVTLNRIKGASANSCGISIEGTAAVEISDNEVSDTERGINCSEESQVKIRAVTIASTGEGVQVDGVSHAEIAGSTITSVKGPCVSYGTNASGTVEKSELKGSNVFEARGNSQVKIAGNTISFEVKGISYRDQSAGAVAGNTFTGTKAAGSCGIGIEGTAAVEVVDNAFSGSELGVICTEESQVKVAGNTIAAGSMGIGYKDRSSGEAALNRITGNSLANSCGISIEGTAEVRLGENEIGDMEQGVTCREESQVKISAVKIASIGEGIRVEGVSNTEITGSTIASAKGPCVTYGVNASGVVEKNELKGVTGLEVRGSSQVKATGNTIAVELRGIQYHDQSAGAASGNRITGTKAGESCGITVEGTAEVELGDNEIGDTERGILCSEESQVKISAARIASVAEGIQVEGISNTAVTGSTIASVKGPCVTYGMNASGAVEKSELKGAVGLEVRGGSQVRAAGNTIVIEQRGIEYRDQSTGTASGNRITGTKAGESCGITVEGTAEVALEDNEIGDTERGILCSEESQVKISAARIASVAEGIQVEGISNAEITGSAVSSVKGPCISYGTNASGVVEKSELKGASGLEVRGSSQVKAAGNTIVIEQRGIEYRDQSTGTASGNRITGIPGGESSGISIEGTAEVELRDNEIGDMERGILCSEESQVKIAAVKITSSGEGIQVEGISNTDVSGSTIRSAKGPCISYGTNASGVVEKNELAGASGLEARGSSQVKVAGNTIVIEQQGLDFRDQSTATASGNTIRGASATNSCGICVEGAAEVEIVDNDVSDTERGISCAEESQVKIGSVRITSAGKGIQVEGISNTEIALSTVSSVKSTCISYGMNASGLVEKNELRGANGIEARGSSQVKAAGNTIVIEQRGIDYRDQSAGAASGNRITGTKASESCGISIEGTAEVELGENEIGDTERGINCGDESQVRITGNTIAVVLRGIEYRGQSSGAASGNRITGTKASESCGISVEGTAEVELSGNEIGDTERGISCVEESEVRISAAKITTTGEGIQVEGVSTTEISGCAITCAKGPCISYGTNTSGVVEKNELAGASGLEARGSSQVKAVGNTIVVGSTGIAYKDQSGGEASLNRITGLPGGEPCGISVEGTAEVAVRGNEIGAVGLGMRCAGSSVVKVDDSIIASRNGGIEAIEMCCVEITESTIASDREGCVRYLAGANGSVERNELIGENGVEVKGNGQVRIAGNTITAERAGVEYADQSVGAVEGNTIEGREGADACGVLITDAADIGISGNTIRKVATGIQCNESSVVAATGNRIASRRLGIDAAGMSSVEAAENVIASEREGCILYSGSASGAVERNELTGLCGVEARGESQVRVTGNTITGTGENETCGIRVEEESEVDIDGNTIRDVNYGVILDYAANVRLFDTNVISAVRAVARQGRRSEASQEGRSVAEERGGAGERRRRPVVRDLVQGFVLRTWQYPVLNRLYRSAYRAALGAVRLCFRGLAGVRCVYLRRGLVHADWIPGSSDIDLFMVIDEMYVEHEKNFLRKVRGRYRFLKTLFPVLGELQIGTEKELKSYRHWGDLRAWESPATWKALFGTPAAGGEYRPDDRKWRVDVVTELLNSYRILSTAFFEGRAQVNRKPFFAKAFIDILKYALYLDGCRPDLPRSRTEVLDRCLAAGGDAAGIPVIEKIRRIWRDNEEADEAFLTGAYLYAVRLIVRKLGSLDGLTAPVTGDAVGAYRLVRSGYHEAAEGLTKWQPFCDDVMALGKDLLRGLVLDEPGLLYIVFADDAADREGFVGALAQIRAYAREHERTGMTPCLALPETMFRAIAASLHLESPFNHFKLPGTPEPVRIDRGYGERRFALYGGAAAAPEPELLALLMREAVTAMNISLRMFNVSPQPLGNRYALVYLYDRVLGLHLALKHRVIVEPYVGSVLEKCREYEDKYREWIEHVEMNYLSRPDSELGRLSPQELFFEHYAFLKTVLNGLSEHISTSGDDHAA